MDFLRELFTQDTIAHSVLVLGLVAALGVMLGSIRVFGISLGIAGVLFAGLTFGHFGLTINEHAMEFAREFGLILFVYTLGIQVGPGFIDSLKRHGLKLSLLAAAVVLIGNAIAVAIHFVADINIFAIVGLYSGGVTNTPSLGAAQQAIKDLAGIPPEAARLPALGYAIAYPFGIIGTILSMLVVKSAFRVDIGKEKELLARQSAPVASVRSKDLVVTNPNLVGLELENVPGMASSGVVVSRVLHDDEVTVARPDTRLGLGDVLHAVGPPKALADLVLIVGKESEIDVTELPSSLITRRLLVTHKGALGKTLEDLDLRSRFGVSVTRVSRAEIQFTPTADYRLHFGDTLVVVGEEDAIKKVASELGDSATQLNHPQLIPVFLGIALGVILGSWPIHIPGMPAPVKLGLAGGPLVVAIILSRLGRIGPIVWYMPISANFMLREVGIVLFLSCVGLKGGDAFVETLTQGDGFVWMAWATLITLVPLIAVGLVARGVYRVNYVTLCGLLAGSMTDPPALAFAQQHTSLDGTSVSYATVYPLVMLLRVISTQAMVMLLAR